MKNHPDSHRSKLHLYTEGEVRAALEASLRASKAMTTDRDREIAKMVIEDLERELATRLWERDREKWIDANPPRRGE